MFKGSIFFAILAIFSSKSLAQWDCGGTTYTPGSTKFTDECYNAVQSCLTQFSANASQVNCQDSLGNLYMQQQASDGSNSDWNSAFEDILDFCLLDGYTTGTWDAGDGQWFWMAAESGCYSTDGEYDTDGPGFCIQDRTDTVIFGCYPEPAASSGGTIQVIETAETPNGFRSSGRGWNSWGIQALSDAASVVPSWTGYNQESVISQCTNLGNAAFQAAGFDTCSLDAGWNSGYDDYGRTVYNSEIFNLPELADYLHGLNLKLGVYIVPGVPCSAANLTIMGTDILIGDALNGNDDGLGMCDFDYSKEGYQQYYDSQIELWASYGVDMIKLDFVTPGSPWNGANLVCNNTGTVEAYHKAIETNGRQMRLDLSWKLCRNETFLPVWGQYAESIRTDQDIDNYGTNTFLAWQVVQRAIDNYRQYISLQMARNVPLTMYPDMDNLFVANPESLTGISDEERITVASTWIGAGANLVQGADLNTIDSLGSQLLTSAESIAASNFAALYPMQPRNPGTGSNLAQQLQAWIGGPSPSNEAYVLLTNYGPDQGDGGFGTSLAGVQEVTISLSDLGISGPWNFTDVWNGNSSIVSDSFTAYLDEGYSTFLNLQSV